MKTVSGAYSGSESAWVSDIIEPEGDIWLDCELPSKGYLIVRQIEPATNKAPKIYQSKETKKINLLIEYIPGYNIQIFTSETPKSIKMQRVS